MTRTDLQDDLDLAGLILAAKGGDAEALNRLISQYRAYLRLMAEQAIGGAIQRREDASDIVQQTVVEAYQSIRDFRGTTEPEFSAWVKQILRRNVANVVRDHRAAKRDHRREQYLDNAEESVSVTWLTPAGGWHASPSQHVIKAEAALKLAMALGKLPEHQRTAVRLRHLQGCSLEEIAQAMEKSPPAVAGLIRRGLQALRDQMAGEASWIQTI